MRSGFSLHLNFLSLQPIRGKLRQDAQSGGKHYGIRDTNYWFINKIKKNNLIFCKKRIIVIFVPVPPFPE